MGSNCTLLLIWRKSEANLLKLNWSKSAYFHQVKTPFTDSLVLRFWHPLTTYQHEAIKLCNSSSPPQLGIWRPRWAQLAELTSFLPTFVPTVTELAKVNSKATVLVFHVTGENPEILLIQFNPPSTSSNPIQPANIYEGSNTENLLKNMNHYTFQNCYDFYITKHNWSGWFRPLHRMVCL